MILERELAMEKKKLIQKIEKIESMEKILGDPEKVLSMDLSELLPETRVKKRILRAFSHPAANIKTVRDLVEHKYSLMRYHGIGKTVIIHLRDVLKPHGLQLKNPGIEIPS